MEDATKEDIIEYIKLIDSYILGQHADKEHWENVKASLREKLEKMG